METLIRSIPSSEVKKAQESLRSEYIEKASDALDTVSQGLNLPKSPGNQGAMSNAFNTLSSYIHDGIQGALEWITPIHLEYIVDTPTLVTILVGGSIGFLIVKYITPAAISAAVVTKTTAALGATGSAIGSLGEGTKAAVVATASGIGWLAKSVWGLFTQYHEEAEAIQGIGVPLDNSGPLGVDTGVAIPAPRRPRNLALEAMDNNIRSNKISGVQPPSATWENVEQIVTVTAPSVTTVAPDTSVGSWTIHRRSSDAEGSSSGGSTPRAPSSIPLPSSPSPSNPSQPIGGWRWIFPCI